MHSTTSQPAQPFSRPALECICAAIRYQKWQQFARQARARTRASCEATCLAAHSAGFYRQSPHRCDEFNQMSWCTCNHRSAPTRGTALFCRRAAVIVPVIFSACSAVSENSPACRCDHVTHHQALVAIRQLKLSGEGGDCAAFPKGSVVLVGLRTAWKQISDRSLAHPALVSLGKQVVWASPDNAMSTLTRQCVALSARSWIKQLVPGLKDGYFSSLFRQRWPFTLCLTHSGKNVYGCLP